MRRTLLTGGGGVKTALPVILYDTLTGQKFQTKKIDKYGLPRYKPIGVVVIPIEHNVYNTGECGVMSLMSASLTTPDIGQTTQASICFGGYGTYYPELGMFTQLPSYGAMNLPPAYNAKTQFRAGYMPLQRQGMVQGYAYAYNKDAYYYDPPTSAQKNNHIYLPSPYNSDDSRNSRYYDWTTDSTNDPDNLVSHNPFSDFNGKSNTEFLCSQSTAQPNWKTDSTITNSAAAGYHPGACTCWRFTTAGTKQGDWYMPSCGEIGYLAPKYDTINGVIDQLQEWYNTAFCPMPYPTLLSSTQQDKNCNRRLFLETGLINYTDAKNSDRCVRPFMRGKFITK